MFEWCDSLMEKQTGWTNFGPEPALGFIWMKKGLPVVQSSCGSDVNTDTLLVLWLAARLTELKS